MTPEQIDISNKKIKYQFSAYVGHIRSNMQLLGEYETAINIIIKSIKDSGERIDIVAHPVLYMMRHSLELGYKCNFTYLEKYSKIDIASIASCHDLIKLHNELKKHFDKIADDLKIDQDLIKEFYKYYDSTTKLINKLGPTETSAFRYINSLRGKKIFEVKEIRNVDSLKKLYDKAIVMLEYTASIISEFTDYVDLLEACPDFHDGIGRVFIVFPSSQLNIYSQKLDENWEKIDKLKWKDKVDNQIVTILTIKNTSYLTPIKNK